MSGLLKRFIREEDGQGMVEYGLIIALIAVVVMGALVTLGGQIRGFFDQVTNQLTPP